MDRIFGDGPRWMLLAILVYAPWAYGCTREWTIQILNIALYSVLGWWLLGCAVRRAWPRVHPVLLIAVVFLLIQGWWMTVNSAWSFDSAFKAHPRSVWLPALPGSVNHALSLPSMLGISGLVGAACYTCDLAARSIWRERLLKTMVLAGASVIVLGLLQKLTGAPGIFWTDEGHAPTFFGTYRYHANASALINMVWPLAAVLFVNSVRNGRPRNSQLFWGGCFVTAIAGSFVNTSRAGGVITGILLLGIAMFFCVRWILRREFPVPPAAVVGIILSLILLVAGAIALGGFDSTMRRWNQIGTEMTLKNSRIMGAKVCVEMLPQSGWFGFGPGTFPTAFPFFNKDTSDATRGVWLQAHQDYLQTLVEWGWIGAAFWAVAIFGAFGRLAWGIGRRERVGSRTQRVAGFGIILAMSGVLIHALADFPLQISSLQLCFGVLVGLAWSIGGGCARRGNPQNGGTDESSPELCSGLLPERRTARCESGGVPSVGLQSPLQT